MNDVNCPYCDQPIEICHDDGFGCDESELHEYQCHACDKYFIFDTYISVTHTAHKADCLNDGKHEYIETNAYPKRFGRMRCKTCGYEKPLPKELLDKYILEDQQPQAEQNQPIPT